LPLWLKLRPEEEVVLWKPEVVPALDEGVPVEIPDVAVTPVVPDEPWAVDEPVVLDTPVDEPLVVP